jgi:hypothetical protein
MREKERRRGVWSVHWYHGVVDAFGHQDPRFKGKGSFSQCDEKGKRTWSSITPTGLFSDP